MGAVHRAAKFIQLHCHYTIQSYGNLSPENRIQPAEREETIQYTLPSSKVSGLQLGGGFEWRVNKASGKQHLRHILATSIGTSSSAIASLEQELSYERAGSNKANTTPAIREQKLKNLEGGKPCKVNVQTFIYVACQAAL